MKKKVIKDSQEFYLERVKDVEDTIFVVQWYDKDDVESLLGGKHLTDDRYQEFMAYCYDSGMPDEINEMLRGYYEGFVEDTKQEDEDE